MVDWPTGTEGVAGGELRDGGSFGRDWGFVLWWVLIAFEGLGSSARSRGRRQWFWTGGGRPGGAGVLEAGTAAEVAGEEGDDLSGLPTATGGSVRDRVRLLEGLTSSGAPYIGGQWRFRGGRG